MPFVLSTEGCSDKDDKTLGKSPQHNKSNLKYKLLNEKLNIPTPSFVNNN